MASNRQYLESIVATVAKLLDKTDEQLDDNIGDSELSEIDSSLDSILSFIDENE